MLRKAFSVAPVSEHGAVTSARACTTSGLGWNEMTLNGAKTEPNGRLNPGFTEYNDTVQYLTDDVTSLIQQGASATRENVIASELGAGRYDSESRPSNHHFEDAQWRGEETLRADLYVKYADGFEQVVKSDDTWKTLDRRADALRRLRYRRHVRRAQADAGLGHGRARTRPRGRRRAPSPARRAS